MSRGRNQRSKFLACCSASSSVGAMSATCNPQPTARAAAAAATTVLPQPTSPCTKPHHRAIGGEIAIDLGERASLRLRQRERQRREEAATRAPPYRAAASAGSPVGVLAQQPQRQLMREQLLEREPPLRRVMPAQQLAQMRVARRPVHHRERVDQRRQLEVGEHRGGNPVAHARDRRATRPSLRNASSISARSFVCGTPSVVG